MKLNCQSVSTSEAGDEIFQILFNAEINQDDGPYLLLQRAFLEEDDGDNVSCYVETNEENLIGHYPNLHADLSRSRLTLVLPSSTNETIEINFQITDQKFRELRHVLTIVLQQNFK
jgi:hypothetical protein